MFRATVREVKSPTDVVVTIDKLFGGGMVRARSRIEVTVGERVLVDDLSTGRVHDWMVVGFENAIGRWGNTGPHTHPIGQVDGLKDFLDTYGEFMGDHEDRMKYAEGKLVEADAAIAQGRLDMAQAEADLAAARDRITKAETDLTDADQRISVGEAERAATIARMDTAELEIQAAGTRIGATENLLTTLDNRVESAETTVQVTAGKLDTVDTRLTTTAGELSTLQTTVGDVQTALSASDAKIDAATSTAATAATAAEDARLAAVAAEDRVRALANAQGSLIVAGGFETVTDENAAYRFATTTARTGEYVGRFRADETAPEVRWPEVRASGSKQLEIRMYAMRSGAVGTAEPYGCLFYRDTAGVLTSVFPNGSSIRPTVNTAWQEYIFRFDPLPTEARSVIFRTGSRSNGSTEAGYILLDDVTAYDTASYQEALDTAIAAQNDAEAAASKALEAMTRANQAYDSAAGKNSIRHATTDPQGNGTATGDVWWKWTTFPGGVVTGQWAWDGTNWVEQKVSHQTIASVDLGKATVGELDGARISAGTLYADRIVSGVSQNMVPDPGFANPELNSVRIKNANAYGDKWAISNGVLTNTPTTGRTGTSNISMGVTSDLYSWPAYPSMKLAVTCVARATGGSAGFRWNIRLRHRDGSTQYTTLRPSAYQQLTPEWATYAFEYEMPETVIGYSVVFQISAIGSSAVVEMKAPMAASKTGGVLIEDGAVTAAKVNAESVAGAVGQFVKVQATNVEVTSELAARVVNAMTTNTKNLVVTESAILQHTTLLGTTVASELNVTKLLRGRDAILSGTIDVAQLNVTNTMSAAIVNAMDVATQKLVVTEEALLNHATLLGTTVAERLNVTKQLIGRDAILTGTVDIDQLNVTSTMSAEIVRAMDTTTKRLIVTEDAILNRATIVQDLVTRDLIAQRVDSRYLRSDSIQTGLLEVFGRFRTAPDGQPQIIIQPSQSSWNNADLAVWFTPDGTTPGGGSAAQFEVTGGMWMNPTRNTGTSWAPQQLNLRGQSRAGVRIMDGLTVQTTAGSVGPTINSGSGQFLNIIGSSGASLTTLDGAANIRPYGDVNIDSRNGGIYMTTTRTRGIALTPGDAGLVLTDQSGSPGYNQTASQAANMYIHSSGKIYRSTSSRRYKKYISDYTFDVTRLRDVRLRKWRDRKQAGQDEDLNYYYGAIAEEIYELYPEHVPMIVDPTWDGDGPAPMIPDSIAYDRLALAAAVTGWQDTDRRLRALEEKLATLGI